MRGLLRSLPPTIVSRKWICQVSARGDVAEGRGHAALGHHRVGLAEQRLADEPDVAPGARASIAARSPAPPAPMTRTSWGASGAVGSVGHRCPAPRSGSAGRRTRPIASSRT